MTTQATETIDQAVHFRATLPAVLKIALIMALRVIGLFMVIPVIAPYASHFPHVTGLQIGLATGIYGLSQALLQIPFGILSDRYGRRLLIGIGLSWFILGSLICAFSQSINIFLLGRFFQGAGAIGSVLIALIADVTPTQHLSKTMAVLGITMGSSFLLAFSIGPYIQHHHGVPALFLLAVGFGLTGLGVLLRMPSTPQHYRKKIQWHTARNLLKDKNLLIVNSGIFLQHAMLAANFVAIPFILQAFDINAWRYYLVILTTAFIAAVPLIRYAENQGKLSLLLRFSIATTLGAHLLLGTSAQHFLGFSGGLLAYFFGFSLLEALLPALASRFAPAADRGLAMGIYSTSQFFGLFCGGTLGGLMVSADSLTSLFFINAALSLVWILSTKHIKIDITPPKVVPSVDISVKIEHN
jgi:MFS family permease